MNPNDVADLLEKAADLYESEQIDWCKGSWGTHRTYDPDTTGVREGVFHCAEGALLRAAGYTMDQLIDAQTRFEDKKDRNLKIERLMNDPLVHAAVVAVDRHEEWGRQDPSLWYFNDNKLDHTKPSEAKQQLITIFKNTAKDLRNKE